MTLVPNSNGEPDHVAESGNKSIHTDKWHRCLNHVRDANAKRGTDYEEHAVCTASIGYSGSYTATHRMGARTPAGRQKKLKAKQT